MLSMWGLGIGPNPQSPFLELKNINKINNINNNLFELFILTITKNIIK